MSIDVNFWAVLLAGISAMVVGTLWYSPMVFGDVWRKTVKLDKKKMQTEMVQTMIITFFAALVTALTIAIITFLYNQFYGHSFLEAGVITAIWLWIGINTPAILSGSLFEQRRKKAILINVGNQLVTLVVMGLIIGAWHS